MLESDPQPELIVYPPERIDEFGQPLDEPVGDEAGRRISSAPDDLRVLPFWATMSRRSGWLLVAGIVVVGLVAGAAVFTQLDRDGEKPTAAPSASSSNSADRPLASLSGTSVPIGTGSPVDLAAGQSLMFVLTRSPARLVVLDRTTTTVLNSVPVPTGSRWVEFDEPLGRLWIISNARVGSVAYRYEPFSLSRRQQVSIPSRVVSASAGGGQMWLGTAEGLYRVGATSSSAARVPAIPGAVDALAADPVHGQVVVATGEDSSTLYSIDDSTGAVKAKNRLGLARVSLAVTSLGLWAAGFGGPQTPKLVQLNAKDMTVSGTSPVETLLGVGAAIWGGGEKIWVRSGIGAELRCISAVDGRVQGHWSGIDGPVVSREGTALAMSSGKVVSLPIRLTSCRSG